MQRSTYANTLRITPLWQLGLYSYSEILQLLYAECWVFLGDPNGAEHKLRNKILRDFQSPCSPA